MRRLKLKWLKYSFVIALFLSCNKDQRQFEKKMKPLKYGKYTIDMVTHHINNGNVESLTFLGYGPFINNNEFAFFLNKIEVSSITRIAIRDYNNDIIMGVLGNGNISPSSFNANYNVNTDLMTIDFKSGDTITGVVTFSRIP